MKPSLSTFDATALYAAMDARRIQDGLSWRQVADQIWDQSSVLNQRRNDHPISPSTLTGIATRRETSCQHALFMLRWLGRTPESFLSPPVPDSRDHALPSVGRDRRLRWNLAALYDALNARRIEQQLTWEDLATQLRCTASQLTGIKTAKFAIGMRLAMNIVQWLERPAATFIYSSTW
jgi:hypothetical protein